MARNAGVGGDEPWSPRAGVGRLRLRPSPKPIRIAHETAGADCRGQGPDDPLRTQDGVVHAVNDVSFTLNKGEFLGVVGESGSGKSVTVMSLLG